MEKSKSKFILVTGAAGFIGSVCVKFLNEHGFINLVLVDDFKIESKQNNLLNKQFLKLEERHLFLNKLNDLEYKLDAIIHLGARTDTTEFNYEIHKELNLEYSKKLWHYATNNQIPFLYASSAATYGNGENGYEDTHSNIEKLIPLNPYGVSKNEFDKWVISQKNSPPFWTGLKFFNVYGPNEGHKGRMASVIFHAFKQIKEIGYVKLFKSHKEGIKNGEQLRDFVYVKDVVKVILWILQKMLSTNWDKSLNGLYNLGTGKARTFYDLAALTFIVQGMHPNIEFVDMPLDVRKNYQYFTEANMTKLFNAGYDQPFSTLEEGINDYVINFLVEHKFY